ncbi:MAG: hypothetical protein ACOH2V_00150 [Candidatus Saccharimonadaceae bacterium]
MAPITSAYQLNLLGGTGISVVANINAKTVTFVNDSPFPGFGVTSVTAAYGNHTHSTYSLTTHTHTLSVLSDTTITSPAAGEILK